MDNITSILIKDTTREQREQIVNESIGNINGACDGCMAGLAEMYRDYIDGKKEIRDINASFHGPTAMTMDQYPSNPTHCPMQ